VFNQRRVRWFELELIHTGSGQIVTEGVSLATQPGTVFFRTPGMVAQGFALYAEADHWDDAGGGSGREQGQVPVNWPTHRCLADPAAVAAGLQKLRALFEILLALESASAPRPASPHRKRLDGLCRQIAASPAAHFDLTVLAASVGVSPNFLCRIFRETYGQTLFQYIHRTKVEAGCLLLLQTDLPIKVVALELGFENQSYFHALFRRRNRYRL